MKLYWAPQTRSARALWMLEEAGRPYERVLIDIRSGAIDARISGHQSDDESPGTDRDLA